MSRAKGVQAARRLVAWAAVAAVCAGTTGCSYISALRYRSRIKTELFTPRRCDPAYLEVRDNIPVLHLYGTPTEMGTQYGTILKGALAAADGYLRALMPESRLKGMLAFADAAEPALPPSIREQIRATAEASGVPYVDLVAMNVVPSLRCTTLTVSGEATGSRPLLMGRNVDYSSFGLSDRSGLVVVYHPTEGVPVVAITFLGMAGAFTGINAEGVSFGNMLVFNAKVRGMRVDGLPVQIAMRVAAEQATSADAMARLLLAQKGMIPMNVMAADAKEAVLLELGLVDRGVRRMQSGVLAASNYFRIPELHAAEVECPRHASLLNDVQANRGRFDVEAMKEALHRARIKDLNLQAVVFEPAAMRMHLSCNREPASAGPYTEFDVRKLIEEK